MEIDLAGKRENVPPGAHICQLFSQPAEAVGIAVSMLKEGLTRRDKCFYAGSESAAQEIRMGLEKCGPKVRRAVETEQMVFVTAKDALLNGGKFDPYFLFSAHQTMIAQARKEGWERLRSVVDMQWLTHGIASNKAIMKYEATCDAAFTYQNAPFVGVFQYDYSKLRGGVVVDMLRLHPIAIVGSSIKRNPYCHNSEEYLKLLYKIDKERRNQPL